MKQRIKAFFKEGLGLNVTSEVTDCVSLEGGGGFVTATLYRDTNGARIDFETREWEEQVKQFAREVS